MAVKVADKIKQLGGNDFKLMDFEDVDGVPSWVNNPDKPTYTAGEVGAVDVKDEVALTDIDHWFSSLFGIQEDKEKWQTQITLEVPTPYIS